MDISRRATPLLVLVGMCSQIHICERGFNMLPVIHIIWNFIVKLISNSDNSSKWCGRDAIFKCIKDNFVLISTIFVLLNWSTLWYLQLVSSVSVKALIYSNILGLCSLFLVRILQPELNGSISPLFKFEKGISFFRQDLRYQRLGSFRDCL